MLHQRTQIRVKERAVCGDGGGTVYCGETGQSREAEGREAGSDWEDEDLTARWQRVQTKWGL